MSFIQYLPEDLLNPTKKEDVINFLNTLPIRWHIKKYTLLEWGEVVDEPIKWEDVGKLTQP